MKNFRASLGKSAAIGALLLVSISLSSCSASGPAPKSSPSETKATTAEVQKVLDDLQVIVDASQAQQDKNGVTESAYVNSQGTQPFEGYGDLISTCVYDPGIHDTVCRFPSNPTYRQKGPGNGGGVFTLSFASDALASYLPTDEAPTEKDGVFTFPGNSDLQNVVIVETKDGLISGVWAQDYLEDPSFTNYYQVNGYNLDNSVANQILNTKE